MYILSRHPLEDLTFDTESGLDKPLRSTNIILNKDKQICVLLTIKVGVAKKYVLNSKIKTQSVETVQQYDSMSNI